MGKHFQRPAPFRRQPATAQPATPASLNAEQCSALADELAALAASAREAAEAVREMAAAGGELAAPANVADRATVALVALTRSLKRAPDVVARLIGGR